MSPEEIESAIVFGGKQVAVRLRPTPEAPGQLRSATVLVRLLPVDPSLVRYIELAADDVQLAEFVCDQPAGWARQLAPHSLLEVVETAHALNFPIARRYAEHRARMAEDLAPVHQRLDLLGARISAASAPAPA